MYAVKLKSTGKFLKKFSGSFNDFWWRSNSRVRPDGTVEPNRTRDEMFCCASPNGAKLYLAEHGARGSVRGYDVEIVKVLVEEKA